MRRLARIAAVIVLLGPGLAAAEPEPIESIVAIVDDDVVLSSELVERVGVIRRQMEQQQVQPPPLNVMASQVLERLILESLQLQMGRRAGVRISDEALTDAINGIAGSNNMTFDQFREALAQDGMAYRDFREQIRREMIIARVQQNRVNNRIRISDQDLDSFTASPLGQFATSDEYRVGHILLAVDGDAPATLVRTAEQEAREVVAALRDGADFQQTAVARSAGARALEGGDLGWRKAAQLPGLFAEAVVGARVGEVLDPIRSGSGFHIVKLMEKRGAGTELVQQVHARHILVRPSEIRSEEETEILIRDIARRIAAGEPFADLARQYSDDPGSGLAGGDLGWSEPGNYVPEFTAVVESLPVGGTSEPFRTQFGWHIVELIDRRDQDMSDEMRRRLAMRYLHARRYDEELDMWLREIRDEAYVEVLN